MPRKCRRLSFFCASQIGASIGEDTGLQRQNNTEKLLFQIELLLKKQLAHSKNRVMPADFSSKDVFTPEKSEERIFLTSFAFAKIPQITPMLFLKRILPDSISEKELITMLILLDRYLAHKRFDWLHEYNIHMLLLTCLRVASKNLRDSKEVTTLLVSFSEKSGKGLRELKMLELELFNAIQLRHSVSEVEYINMRTILNASESEAILPSGEREKELDKVLHHHFPHELCLVVMGFYGHSFRKNKHTLAPPREEPLLDTSFKRM